MGYGLGVFLLAVGLILAFAVDYAVSGVDIHLVGLILAGAGLAIVVLTAATAARGRRSASVTTHRDGSQTVTEQRSDAPPVA